MDPDEEINTLEGLKARYPHFWEVIEEVADNAILDLSAFELDSVIRTLVELEVTFVNEDEVFKVNIDLADGSWTSEFTR